MALSGVVTSLGVCEGLPGLERRRLRGEKDPSDEFAARANPYFGERGLEVVLHGPMRDPQLAGDRGRVHPRGDMSDNVAFPGGQAVGLGDEGREVTS